MPIEVLQNRVTGTLALGSGSESTLNTLAGLTLGRKYFFNWHAHVAQTSDTRSLLRFRIDGTNVPNYDGSFRGINGIFNDSSFWYGQTVATPLTVNSVNWGGEAFGPGAAQSEESSIMAISLDGLIENTDYFFIEDAVAKANIDNVYGNNIGANITFTPDGTSDYAIFAMGTTDNPSSNTSRNVASMRLYDATSATQLNIDGRDVYTPSVETGLIYTHNALWVLNAPAAVSKTINLEFVGNNDWDYKYSNLFILRLNAFQDYGFDQTVVNSPIVGTGVNDINALTWTDPSQDVTWFSRAAVDTVDADSKWGVNLTDQFLVEVDWGASGKEFAGGNAAPGGAGEPISAILLHQDHSVDNSDVLRQNVQQVVDDGTKTIREATLIAIGQSLVAEFDPPVVSNQSPAPGATDVSLNSDVSFRVASNTAAGVDILTIDVSIDRGSGFEAAIIGGIFQSGFDGPQSSIDALVDNSGYDINIDIVTPFPTSQSVDVQIDADNLAQGVSMSTVNYSFTTASVAFIYSFRTETFRYVVPQVFTDELDLTSLPSGYSPQTLIDGSPPTYSSNGMTTIPNSGASYIKRSSAGLDFDQGLLIDMEVFGTGVDTKVLQVSKGNQGRISVNVDFTTGEIYLNNIVNTPPPGFRPGVKNDVVGEVGVQFRLTIKGSGDELVARLYSGIVGATEPILLKQTGGPSNLMEMATDFIDIGSIESGGSPVRVSKVNILNLEDPDEFYPFPNITDLFPTNDILSGTKTFRLQFGTSIDLGAGTELFFVDETVRDESTGAGSSSEFKGDLTLSLSGLGTAAVRFMRSYSGDLPSASDMSIVVNVPSALVNTLPQNEIILAAMQLLAGGDTITAEYVADIREGTYFRIVRTSGGLETLRKIILRSSKTSFTYRFLRAGNKLLVQVDGTTLINTNFKDGVGIVRLFTKNNDNISFDTIFNNFEVRPVIMIGDSIVDA